MRMGALLMRAVLALFGINFLLAGGLQWQLVDARLRDSHPGRGKVLERVKESRFGDRPRVEFSAPAGIAASFLHPGYYPFGLGPAPGEEVALRYRPEAPEQALIDSFWGHYGTALEYLLLGVLGLGGALWRGRAGGVRSGRTPT